jgi:hypothetical protein
MKSDEIRVVLERAVTERSPFEDAGSKEVREAVARIADLLAALPESAQRGWLQEAVARMRVPGSSLRKLEKRLRQALIMLASAERIREVVQQAPEIRIDDVHGALRFRQSDEVEVRIGGTRMIVPVVARILGGPLELLLFTATTSAFIDAARAALAVELADAREAAAGNAAAIDAILDDRVHRSLYDVRALRRIVQRAVRDEVVLEAALVRITAEIAPLDRAAAERERVRALVEQRGLIAYRDYFPLARSLRRELVLFTGPTNSGKTWRALNELAAARSGAYLAPLRLLALEGQEEIEKRGRIASYLTGEERDIRPDADFIASTIEMMNTEIEVDVVVIDEVQLLSDVDRGWAWCQAVVGAPAKRVLMTGSPDCIPVVRALADYLGEPLTVHCLERHTPIIAEPRPISLAAIEPGTAVIAFSRRDVLALKAKLESRYRVAVIYGNLTPEVRREEARRFRAGDAEVVVSTDAIAMGLNLPIRTVCFSTLRKWNGREEVELEPWEILQIGGRAGRFGHHERGHVGAFSARDARRIARVFDPEFTPPERDVAATVRPGREHIEVIAEGLHTPRLATALAAFQRGMTFDSSLLAPGVNDEMIQLAQIADRFRDIPLAERLVLACAPVDARLNWLIDEYAEWIAAHADAREVHLPPLDETFDKEYARHDQELMAAEHEAKRLTLYSWLGFRFAETFPDLDTCTAQRVALDRFIERSLARRAMAGTDKHAAEKGRTRRPQPGGGARHGRHKPRGRSPRRF